MRKFFTTAFVLVATMLIAASGLALEKTTVRVGEGHADAWSQDHSCSVIYYNTCTGWLYGFYGWSPGDVFGTVYTSCCNLGETSVVATGWARTTTGAPSGYGFTGTFGLWDSPAPGCIGAPIMVFPFLNPGNAWNQFVYGVTVGGPFCQAFEAAITPVTSPEGWGCDHPAIGPTGVQACGTCYPSPRVVNSYWFGTLASPMCPGTTLSDGVCDVEFMNDVQMFCTIGVEESSWGTIKGLYR